MQSEKILALTNAASVDLEPIWASLLAKALEGKNVKDLLSNVGAGGAGPAAAPAGGAAAGAAAAEAPKEEEKKEEEKEESDDDMVRAPAFVRGRVGNADLGPRVGLRSLRLISLLSSLPSCLYVALVLSSRIASLYAPHHILRCTIPCHYYCAKSKTENTTRMMSD